MDYGDEFVRACVRSFWNTAQRGEREKCVKFLSMPQVCHSLGDVRQGDTDAEGRCTEMGRAHPGYRIQNPVVSTLKLMELIRYGCFSATGWVMSVYVTVRNYIIS